MEKTPSQVINDNYKVGEILKEGMEDNKKMRVIDLLNKIANGEIEDKRTFNINFGKGVYRSIYYDKDEENCMCCLKNVSDDYSIYDGINFNTEVESKDYEEEKKIKKLIITNLDNIVIIKKTNEIIDKINEIIDYLEENK